MLEALLAPNAVAVVGASRDPAKVGHALLANLKAGGFAGTIVPVNPKADSILDLPCAPDLASSGEEIDLAVIAVPTAAVLDAVEDAIAAAAKAVVVITAGFRETGPKGAKLEAAIAARCAADGVRLLGPNCLGVINTEHRLNATFATHTPAPGGISVVSQSGAVCTAMLDWAAERGMGLAKLVSIGNKADLTEVDLLRALGEDAQTRVIVAYLESIASGDAFIKAAEEASARKPIVALKVGTSEAGGRAASSHTGSLAGADIAYGAAFRRAGVIRAESFEQLLDFATAFAMQPIPKGRRVAIVTNAGGPGIMAADAVEREDLEVATLGTGTATALKRKLPAAASVANPIDVLGDADPDRYVAAVRAAQADPSVDALLVLLTPQAMTSPEATARAVAEFHRSEMPVVAAFMGGWDVLPAREELVATGLPDYPTPERAAAAIRAMWEYAAWLRRPARVVTRFAVNRRRVERIIARHLRSGERQLGEDYGKKILAAYDLRVPEGEPALNGEEAVEVADRIGYPVAMKILSPDIIHKSDLGGVRLGLGDGAAVRDAFDLMLLRVRRALPKARITGVYVERMCEPGREVILGMTRDPQFGPMLMFGLGGIFVEVMKDVAFHLAPITADEAMEMLRATRSYALLEGARGQAGVDLGAVAGALQRLSQLTTDFPRIVELDINPLIVGAPGTVPTVADVRMTLADAGAGQ